MKQADHITPLTKRRDAILQWLDDTAPYAEADQCHLDADTPERAYWHLGYQAALADVIDMLFSDAAAPRSEGTSSSSPSDDPDGDGSRAA